LETQTTSAAFRIEHEKHLQTAIWERKRKRGIFRIKERGIYQTFLLCFFSIRGLFCMGNGGNVGGGIEKEN
jgi:uncharacterized BrkB/YihY/UPF0761 family membrane protein